MLLTVFAHGVLSVVIVASGLAITVRLATVLVTVAQTLLNTARYCFALSLRAVLNVYVALVAPVMLLNDPPPLTLTCHCTVGVGLPEADAANEAELPAHAIRLVGLPVTTAGVLTATTWLHMLPQPFVL